MALALSSPGAAPLITAAQLLSRTSDPSAVFRRHASEDVPSGTVDVPGALRAFSELGVKLSHSEASSLVLKQRAGDRGGGMAQALNYERFLSELGVGARARAPGPGTETQTSSSPRAMSAAPVIAARIAEDRGFSGEGYEVGLHAGPPLRTITGNAVMPAVAQRESELDKEGGLRSFLAASSVPLPVGVAKPATAISGGSIIHNTSNCVADLLHVDEKLDPASAAAAARNIEFGAGSGKGHMQPTLRAPGPFQRGELDKGGIGTFVTQPPREGETAGVYELDLPSSPRVGKGRRGSLPDSLRQPHHLHGTITQRGGLTRFVSEEGNEEDAAFVTRRSGGVPIFTGKRFESFDALHHGGEVAISGIGPFISDKTPQVNLEGFLGGLGGGGAGGAAGGQGGLNGLGNTRRAFGDPLYSTTSFHADAPPSTSDTDVPILPADFVASSRPGEFFDNALIQRPPPAASAAGARTAVPLAGGAISLSGGVGSFIFDPAPSTPLLSDPTALPVQVAGHLTRAGGLGAYQTRGGARPGGDTAPPTPTARERVEGVFAVSGNLAGFLNSVEADAPPGMIASLAPGHPPRRRTSGVDPYSALGAAGGLGGFFAPLPKGEGVSGSSFPPPPPQLSQQFNNPGEGPRASVAELQASAAGQLEKAGGIVSYLSVPAPQPESVYYSLAADEHKAYKNRPVPPANIGKLEQAGGLTGFYGAPHGSMPIDAQPSSTAVANPLHHFGRTARTSSSGDAGLPSSSAAGLSIRAPEAFAIEQLPASEPPVRASSSIAWTPEQQPQPLDEERHDHHRETVSRQPSFDVEEPVASALSRTVAAPPPASAATPSPAGNTSHQHAAALLASGATQHPHRPLRLGLSSPKAVALAASEQTGLDLRRLARVRKAIRDVLPKKANAAASVLKQRLRREDGDGDGRVSDIELLRGLCSVTPGLAASDVGFLIKFFRHKFAASEGGGAEGGSNSGGLGAGILTSAVADWFTQQPGGLDKTRVVGAGVMEEGEGEESALPPPSPAGGDAGGRLSWHSKAQRITAFRAGWEERHGAAGAKELAADAAQPAEGPTWTRADPVPFRVLHLAAGPATPGRSA